MQTQVLLLAAASAAMAAVAPFPNVPVANLAPRATSDSGLTGCDAVYYDALSVIAAVPTPTDPAFFSYADSQSTATATDACAAIRAAPTSIQSELSSYKSGLDAAFKSHADILSSLTVCASKSSDVAAAEITEVLNLPDCAGTKNAAAPRETGVAAMGMAAAALIGVVGML
ncbi:hypothetical protein GQ53DRAFT_749634 [Thozetella sp. PMI_491]|nr:hypothetical protein GQ53DRAFT_749634 [Thozetella sp. PMI_491]